VANTKAAEVLSVHVDVNIKIKQYWQAHTDCYQQILCAPSQHAIKAYFKPLLNNSKLGVKLSLMQHVDTLAFKAGFAQFAGLVLLEVTMYAINNYWSFAPATVFNQYGIGTYWLNFSLIYWQGLLCVIWWQATTG